MQKTFSRIEGCVDKMCLGRGNWEMRGYGQVVVSLGDGVNNIHKV